MSPKTLKRKRPWVTAHNVKVQNSAAALDIPVLTELRVCVAHWLLFFLKLTSKISQSSCFISSTLQHRFHYCFFFNNKSSIFFLSLLSMSRSPLNTKRRSRKKRRKTRRKRRRRRSITTSTSTATEVRRSRCRTARWRRKSPCRSVWTLRLAACAPAHVSSTPWRLAVPALTPAHLSFSPCRITDCSLKTRTSRWWVLTEPRDSFLFIWIPVLTPTNSCCCTAFSDHAAGTVLFFLYNTADWPRFNYLKTFICFSIIEVDVLMLLLRDRKFVWSMQMVNTLDHVMFALRCCCGPNAYSGFAPY